MITLSSRWSLWAEMEAAGPPSRRLKRPQTHEDIALHAQFGVLPAPGEVARDYKTSRNWVHQLVNRFETGGVAAFHPRSKDYQPLGRPHPDPADKQPHGAARRRGKDWPQATRRAPGSTPSRTTPPSR